MEHNKIQSLYNILFITSRIQSKFVRHEETGNYDPYLREKAINEDQLQSDLDFELADIEYKHPLKLLKGIEGNIRDRAMADGT